MARGPSSKEPREDREVRRREILEQLDGDQAGSPEGRATSVLQALKKVAERCDMASTVKEVLEVTPRGEGVGPGGLGCPDRGNHHCCITSVHQAVAHPKRVGRRRHQVEAHRRLPLGVARRVWKRSHR